MCLWLASPLFLEFFPLAITFLADFYFFTFTSANNRRDKTEFLPLVNLAPFLIEHIVLKSVYFGTYMDIPMEPAII
ncbi:hypothetical protein B0T20DRAFT_48090 [Sordaria brevicollis]|uniref:Uncharacterized protein n=1 Tax=Sordaria brevicollis TaxID=83679 RepID=A0AAE0P9P2_SORBR|nr:hypothetical protein B0T20DRAFT_48090 [Sordaria brevicollis]